MAGRKRKNISEYSAVWIFAMFDLPVDDKIKRKKYRHFRELLLSEGFTMMQFSVYARYCASEEKSKSICAHLKVAVPSEGQVRILTVTDRQFGKMEVYIGKKRIEPERKPRQMLLY